MQRRLGSRGQGGAEHAQNHYMSHSTCPAFGSDFLNNSLPLAAMQLDVLCLGKYKAQS